MMPSFSLFVFLLISVEAKHFFLISFHGGSRNGSIVRYKEDGSFDSEFFTKDDRKGYAHPRGLLWLESKKELLVLDDHATHGYVVQFNCTSCAAHGSVKSEFQDNKLMVHPFALTVSAKQDEYFVTQQNGGTVISVKSDLKTGNLVSDKTPDPRGIALGSDGFLYVAPKAGYIYILHPDTGKIYGSIAADVPISVLAYKDYIIYGTKKRSEIYFWDTKKGKASFTLESSDLKHVAGLSVHNDTLFALSWEYKKLLSFDIEKQKYNGVIINKLPDYPEGLAIVDC